ncbi:MAG: DUF72 domain-containing protein [Deltaproteobacteria bacterium]|nr:DUF72 domain-containing protein [Deltaproteobacteria bacterium]MBI3293932.1 DUF72 domain-containing protein [Deltaproteobacteria bacterium]
MTLEGLAHKQVFLGTSSWKYEGWKGLVYNKAYQSKKEFETHCLEEYPYTCVGVDHTYYAYPLKKTFATYCKQTKALFGLKATEFVTVVKFPKLPRYGKLAGQNNPDFLNPDVFHQQFLAPIEEFQAHIGVVMFEFSHFHQGMIENGRELLKRLGAFFAKLPRDRFRFAIELRNHTWITKDYFAFLKDQGLGHVFNSWTRMPTIGEQLKVWNGLSLPFLAARVLLTPGRPYEKAVEAFSPYDRIQDEQPELRKDSAYLIERAIQLGIPAFVFVNNRAEGCAPKTIEGILKHTSLS